MERRGRDTERVRRSVLQSDAEGRNKQLYEYLESGTLGIKMIFRFSKKMDGLLLEA